MRNKLKIRPDHCAANMPQCIGTHDLNLAYEELARDELREAEAMVCAEAVIGDVADEIS